MPQSVQLFILKANLASQSYECNDIHQSTVVPVHDLYIQNVPVHQSTVVPVHDLYIQLISVCSWHKCFNSLSRLKTFPAVNFFHTQIKIYTYDIAFGANLIPYLMFLFFANYKNDIIPFYFPSTWEWGHLRQWPILLQRISTEELIAISCFNKGLF
jgi:hypothetical protein